MLKGWRPEKDKTCLPWSGVSWLRCHFRGWWYRPAMEPKSLCWTETQGHWTWGKDTQQVSLTLGEKIFPLLIWRSMMCVLSTRPHPEPPLSSLYKRESDTHHTHTHTVSLQTASWTFYVTWKTGKQYPASLLSEFTSNFVSLVFASKLQKEKNASFPGNFLLPL